MIHIILIKTNRKLTQVRHMDYKLDVDMIHIVMFLYEYSPCYDVVFFDMNAPHKTNEMLSEIYFRAEILHKTFHFINKHFEVQWYLIYRDVSDTLYPPIPTGGGVSVTRCRRYPLYRHVCVGSRVSYIGYMSV